MAQTLARRLAKSDDVADSFVDFRPRLQSPTRHRHRQHNDIARDLQALENVEFIKSERRVQSRLLRPS